MDHFWQIPQIGPVENEMLEAYTARYQLRRALDSPGPLHTPYLMIGGVGEKRTLRLVAQYADACNLFPGPELPRKLAVLREHCDAVGREYAEIEKTISLTLDADESADDLVRRAEQTRELGFTVAYVNAIGITEPGKIVDTPAEAATRLA